MAPLRGRQPQPVRGEGVLPGLVLRSEWGPGGVCCPGRCAPHGRAPEGLTGMGARLRGPSETWWGLSVDNRPGSLRHTPICRNPWRIRRWGRIVLVAATNERSGAVAGAIEPGGEHLASGLSLYPLPRRCHHIATVVSFSP